MIITCYLSLIQINLLAIMWKLCSLLVLSTILLHCVSTKISAPAIDLSTIDLPNGLPLYDNVYVDRTEISNINYKEYLHWTKRIFGRKSEEFQSALPDTLVWSNINPSLDQLTNQYLGHFYFDDFPVVGVSHQQAIHFSTWRADRIMEGLLIEHFGYFNTSLQQTPKTYFTIERYFADELKLFRLNKNVKHFPVCRLPNEDEWKIILQKHTTDIKATFEDCDSPECQDCITHNYRYQVDIPAICNVETEIFPLSPVNIGCHTDSMITHVIGNVAEWSDTPGFTFGSSWRDKKNIARLNPNDCTKSNAWTGFRNISYWKAVEE